MSNPAYKDLIRKVDEDSGEVCCPNCYSALVGPENCIVCHGDPGFSTFCPKCDDDCGCVRYL